MIPNTLIPFIFGILGVVTAVSDNFSLIAVTSYDINSAIQLYPLVIVDGKLALSKTGNSLQYSIDNSGYASILGTSYKLVVDNNGLLTANNQGTPIFFVAGSHLHYNSSFVYVACPQDNDNTTFTVYATSNLAICDNSLYFTFRPIANESDIITSYIPPILSQHQSSTSSSKAAASTALGTNGLITGLDSTRTTKSNLFTGGIVSSVPSSASNVVVETTAVSTTVMVSNGALVTQTIYQINTQNLVSINTVLTYIASTLGGGGLTTIVSTKGSSETTQESVVQVSITGSGASSTSAVSSLCLGTTCKSTSRSSVTFVGSSFTGSSFTGSFFAGGSASTASTGLLLSTTSGGGNISSGRFSRSANEGSLLANGWMMICVLLSLFV